MNFLSELSRRNVIRVTGLYAVAGWIILQVITTVAPLLGLPDWFDTAILVLLLAGLPIIAIGAWAFEITPEGLRREQSSTNKAEARVSRLDIGILVALIAVIGVGLWLNFSREPAAGGPVAQSDGDTSIAVLAFEDLSADQDHEYFADGISEEILNLLVRVEGLQVASRTSSFQYKNRPLGISDIAHELGVGHVLEGSVRRAGDRVRITAQLIDARTDRHLWSDNFDRDMTDIFEIQDEIADAIVAALADSLGLAPEDANVDVVAVTANLSAYDAYLEGRQLFHGRNGLDRAVQLLERAVELDPEFVDAWETLASVYAVAPAWGLEDRDYQELATSAARRALELDDTRSTPYAVLAAALLNSGGSFVEGMRLLEQALERDPNNITALHWYANNLFFTGYLEQSYRLFTRCLEIDPTYTICRNNLIDVLISLEKYDEALEATRIVLEQGYANPSNGMFEAFAHAGERDQVMLLMGEAIGFGAPLGALADALIDPENHDINDAYALAEAYAEANPEEMNAANLYYYAARIGFDPLPEVTEESREQPPWYPFFDEFRNSDAFKEGVREIDLLGYWRENGFPDLCRPVGDDDFECD